MTKKTAHIISHTHWDREWYLPYEKHHFRLINLMDNLLELLSRDPEFKSFHLDGQTIILEDYLQVRPEKRVEIIKYCKEGRLQIGPWYILQDEFLTSSEANVRNLLMGHRDAREFGAISRIGYFPDSFGNMGQAPQILQQAGIDNAVFGRGVKAVGFNNSIDLNSLELESPYSELLWESPDGSHVLGILFANWYHNGMEIPVDEEGAKCYWEERLANVERFASTPHLLFMNGCDHQPVQSDLSQALATARKLYPNIEFVHSNFTDYINQVKQNVPKELKKIVGELRGQHTDGWYTLANTASTRMYLKQMNHRCQTLLEKVAEPLAAYANQLGHPYPHHLFNHAWKTLMKNHPHDSICGCSVDEVHREMVTRFDQSRQLTEMIIDTSLGFISKQIDTTVFCKHSNEAIPFVVYNSSGWMRNSTVTIDLQMLLQYLTQDKTPTELVNKIESIHLPKGFVIDEEGNKISCSIEDRGVQFGYELPDDKFRKPYMSKVIRITMEAKQIPAIGYKTYAWIALDEELLEDEAKKTLVLDERSLENEYLLMTIADNGTLTITEKESGHTFHNLCAYEDVGDIGNEYIFKQPNGEKRLTTYGLAAEIELVEDTPYRATYKITHSWDIPTKADNRLTEEMKLMVPFLERKAQRMDQTVTQIIQTFVSLEKKSKGVFVKSTFRNECLDHRLRMLFPTDLECSSHHVDSVFEVVTRPNQPSVEWINPSNCQHQHAFVDMSARNSGITIANRGLQEYEVLRDESNTIAVTLIRAVGELGDWGYFPTPEAQCLGDFEAELLIVPHRGMDYRYEAYQEAYQFQFQMQVQQSLLQKGTLSPTDSFFTWEGTTLAFSSLKVNEDRGDTIARWFNMSNEVTQLKLHTKNSLGKWYPSNILEDITSEEQTIELDTLNIGGSKIITIGYSE